MRLEPELIWVGTAKKLIIRHTQLIIGVTSNE